MQAQLEEDPNEARTRKAILDAAVELVSDGHLITVPGAAERAQVSVATAYRYFPSVDLLIQEASNHAFNYLTYVEEVLADIDAAGDIVHDRVEALARSVRECCRTRHQCAWPHVLA